MESSPPHSGAGRRRQGDSSLPARGDLWPDNAQPFKKTQPAFVVSPSYKFSDTETGYISWQYGEKAGIAQVVNGLSDLVLPEKNTSYEIGLKSSLLHHTLVLDADIYLTNIKNYQQSVRIVDQYTTNLNIQSGVTPVTAYTSTTGNVPKVQSKGIEVDAIYSPFATLSLRLSAAYIDAFYKSFPNSAQPLENGYTGAPPYRDVTGQALAGASRVYANLGVDYRLPVSTPGRFVGAQTQPSTADSTPTFALGICLGAFLHHHGFVRRRQPTRQQVRHGCAREEPFQ